MSLQLFWGIPKGEYKPMLFNCTGVPNADYGEGKELLATVGKNEAAIRKISTVFHMEPRDLDNLLNHYGIVDVPRIIGCRTCEVTYFADAKV
ncbi:MAG: hypothetical protein IKG01_02245 [Lachnospiraceae bacterium]|nr:hypothetical protein [Lachnospiraceae bacterium]